MTASEQEHHDCRRVSRRHVLAAAGAAVAGLAGCSGLQDQSFSASPVVLPEADQTDLVLPETDRSSNTTTRTVAGGNVNATITSHLAVYRRAPALEGS